MDDRGQARTFSRRLAMVLVAIYSPCLVFTIFLAKFAPSCFTSNHCFTGLNKNNFCKDFWRYLSCFTCQKKASTYHQTRPMEKCIALILHGTQYARLNVMMDSNQRENMLSSTNTTQSQESGTQEGKSFPGPTACSVSTTLSQCSYLRLCSH